jgi:hypothetical protein
MTTSKPDGAPKQVGEFDTQLVVIKVLDHIDTMYPKMWESVPKSARTSLRNTIVNSIEHELRLAAPAQCDAGERKKQFETWWDAEGDAFAQQNGKWNVAQKAWNQAAAAPVEPYDSAAVREALERIQWGSCNGIEAVCPICARSERGGHSTTCFVGAALASTPAEPSNIDYGDHDSILMASNAIVEQWARLTPDSEKRSEIRKILRPFFPTVPAAAREAENRGMMAAAKLLCVRCRRNEPITINDNETTAYHGKRNASCMAWKIRREHRLAEAALRAKDGK